MHNWKLSQNGTVLRNKANGKIVEILEYQYRLLIYTGFWNQRSLQLYLAIRWGTIYYIQCYQLKKKAGVWLSLGKFVKTVEKTPQSPHENFLLSPLKVIISKSSFPILKPQMFEELTAKSFQNLLKIIKS